MHTGRRSIVLPLFGAVGLAVLAGCPNRDVSAVDPKQAKEGQTKIPVSVNRDIDILFVVDNSGSMDQEQQALADNFPEFIRVLESIEGGLPNVHIGVISSNVGTGPQGEGGTACAGDGDNGILQVPAACNPLTDGKRFIIDSLVNAETGERQTNYTGTLAEQFSCMARLGINGCGFEQHLESMKRALENATENGGFLRDGAYLAVIFIQDEDDCSAHDRSMFASDGSDTVESELGELSSFRCFEFGTTCEGPSDERQVGPRQNCVAEQNSPYMTDISEYVDFLKGLKDDPSRVIVAAITGGTDPVSVGIDPGPGPTAGQVWVDPQCVVCPGGGTECFPNDLDNALVSAAPAIRMNTFLNAFPARSTFQSICNYNPTTGRVDFTGALNQIAELLKTVIGSPCIEGRLVEPYECEVADVQAINTENQVEHKIPSCDASGGATPCWRFVEDPSCNTETNLSLEIDRGGGDPPPDTTVVARCLLES